LKCSSTGAAALVLVLAGLAAFPSPATTAKKAYYTAAQAGTGAKAYAANCASCHGTNLEGVKAPALAGPGMAGSQSVADIYEFAVQQMPAGAPGSLSAATYTSIMAFILKKNGHPAGTVALTPKSAAKISEKI
jgi:mono/diheme cytochrome c family protein